MKRIVIPIFTLLVSLAILAPAQDSGPGKERHGGRGERDASRKARPGPTSLPAEVKKLETLSILLGRPTDKSIVISVVSAEAREGYIEYGMKPDEYTAKTDIVKLPAGVPVEVKLEKIGPDAEYFYRLWFRGAGEADFTAGHVHDFHTQRAPGGSFIFEIQGDSHPERPQMFDSALYAHTLLAAAADRPDFYMTIGDDFSVDALSALNAETVTGRYTLQRPFLALVGQSAPVFLVNGNHEQASLYNLDGTANNAAVWAQTARNKFFPQPTPDGFYTGDDKPVEHIGLLADYYAWTWGDALFVVIDPYWHSAKPVDNVLGGGEKNRDLWAVTLGQEQYQWLKKMLESSKARYKFVFAHHVLGTGRGGIEEANPRPVELRQYCTGGPAQGARGPSTPRILKGKT